MSSADPTPSSDAPPPAPTRKPPWKERLKQLIEEYGPIALVVYLGTSLLSWGVAVLLFSLGLQKVVGLSGAAETVGLVGFGYALSKLTQPFRIAATFALTPIVARLWDRLRRRTRSKA